MTFKIDKSATLTQSITLRASSQPSIDTTNMTTSGDVETAETAAPQAAANDTIKEHASDNGGSTAGSGSGGPTASGRSTLQRKLSISELATAGSSGRKAAPFYLKWLERPFRVKNIQTGEYLEEATAHVMDATARGPINQTGSMVGNAMLRIAMYEAGPEKNKVYGMQAASILTIASMIVGITAGITMPFVGALVDHSDQRKAMGSISALVVVVAVAAQISINADTWFFCFIMEIIGGYCLILHQTCTMAFLPDLSHDLTEMGHYTARFMMNQYFMQALFTLLVIGVSYLDITNLQVAKFAAGLSASFGAIMFGYSWIFLFRKRPKLREVPPGMNVFNSGFRQLWKTTKMIFKEYKALRWFLIALLFSPEAGAGVVLAIAVTFLTLFVDMNIQEISQVSIIMLFCNIPGAYLSKIMCRLINPLNSFRCAEIMFAICNGLIAWTVTGSTQKDKSLVYFFAGTIGIAFGWMFPSQRTLSVALIPKGQETEIMGIISFFGQIVGWLPVFVFTLLMENGVSMRWGLASVSFFLLTSCFFTFFCGNFDDAVASVAHTSDEYLEEFRRKSGVEGRASFVDSGSAPEDANTNSSDEFVEDEKKRDTEKTAGTGIEA